MKKLFLIACANMRKAKGQTIAIVSLILLAALMLNLFLMLTMDYRANFNRYHDKLNAEHVTLVVDDSGGEVNQYLSQTLGQNNEISQFRLNRAMSLVGTFSYNGGKINNQFVILPKDVALAREIGKAEIVKEGNISSGVYLPMIYQSKDYKVGATIEIFIGSRVVSYTICGFFNSVMMGSHNCAMTELILSQDRYDELSALGYASKATLCSVRLEDRSLNIKTEAELKNSVSRQFPNVRMVSNCYGMVSQSRYISQGVSSSIMSVMAFLVLLIAVVVIVTNITNYIRVNIKNLGVLKAEGYTSKQLVCALLLQFLFLTMLAAVAGAILSYCLFPAINSMMIMQTGIPYTIRFLPLPLLISFGVLGGAVAFFVWLSARRIRKIQPIVALRSGLQTHNFKRNRIPLENTKAPLHFALALKTTFSSIKQNLAASITMLVLSLIVVFSGMMTENVIADMTPFLDLIIGETTDSCVNIQPESEGEFLAKMRSDPRVEKIYLFHSSNVTHAGGAELMATMCDDFSQVNNQSVVFTGRFPKFENEIALAAKYARENGFHVGDEIEITSNGKTETYLISGLTQMTNYLGRDCLLTRKGYERLALFSDLSYYINLADGTDIDAFHAEVQEMFADDVNSVININEVIQGAGSVYVSLITVIVIAILALSVMIVAFVLYLLVRTLLNNKMRDYGILKSLGFTTKQLILQTALSFMPAIILSTILGLVISSFVINPLAALFLSAIGIVECTFQIPIVFVTVAGFGLIALSFMIACLFSLKIRKIAPRALLAGE